MAGFGGLGLGCITSSFFSLLAYIVCMDVFSLSSIYAFPSLSVYLLYSYSICIGIIPLYIFGNRNLFSLYFRADFGQLYWISIDFLGLYDLSNVIFALA